MLILYYPDWSFQLKSSLAPPKYILFIKTLTAYQKIGDLNALIVGFAETFDQLQFHYLFRGMRRFVKEEQKIEYDAQVAKRTSLWLRIFMEI